MQTLPALYSLTGFVQYMEIVCSLVLLSLNNGTVACITFCTSSHSNVDENDHQFQGCKRNCAMHQVTLRHNNTLLIKAGFKHLGFPHDWKTPNQTIFRDSIAMIKCIKGPKALLLLTPRSRSGWVMEL